MTQTTYFGSALLSWTEVHRPASGLPSPTSIPICRARKTGCFSIQNLLQKLQFRTIYFLTFTEYSTNDAACQPSYVVQGRWIMSTRLTNTSCANYWTRAVAFRRLSSERRRWMCKGDHSLPGSGWSFSRCRQNWMKALVLGLARALRICAVPYVRAGTGSLIAT